MLRALLPLPLLAPVALAQPAPPVKAAASAAPTDTKALSESVRTLLLANLPDPLVQSGHHWGEQKEVFSGIYWEKKGVLRYKPEKVKELKNDGRWERVTVEASDPAKTLKVTLGEVRTPEAGKTQFDAVIQTDVKLKYENQVWAFGKRLYAGETRAKCTAGLTTTVELTSRTEPTPGQLLPTVVFRVRVTQAKLSYWDLECEHTLGVGGDAAKVIGNAVYDVLKAVKPDMEKDLLERANAAVVKAADTKEVRAELGNLLKANK